ncbi:hypothetical protein GGR52DRAFT_567499 [Hypoxylon sp. FL1284]|nr:hypothetical protein GGR52DRAFT_567499 [Hypoxylon sp. FL1284]
MSAPPRRGQTGFPGAEYILPEYLCDPDYDPAAELQQLSADLAWAMSVADPPAADDGVPQFLTQFRAAVGARSATDLLIHILWMSGSVASSSSSGLSADSDEGLRLNLRSPEQPLPFPTGAAARFIDNLRADRRARLVHAHPDAVDWAAARHAGRIVRYAETPGAAADEPEQRANYATALRVYERLRDAAEREQASAAQRARRRIEDWLARVPLSGFVVEDPAEHARVIAELETPRRDGFDLPDEERLGVSVNFDQILGRQRGNESFLERVVRVFSRGR